MTQEEQAELDILRRGNEKGKFAINISTQFSLQKQEALERLQVRRWITLIDVSFIAHDSGVYRIFLMSSEAMQWRKDQ